ncbi:MAG: ribosomal protein S18 acetylase RimI-like enzyme [Kiritimatiellia bacterium]|jgi:ribosomal protein S18 acetylase RimI-like enzyme
MNVMEMENAGRHAWPALEEQELSFGVMRYSRGTDRRSNSLSLYPHAEFETGKLIDATEKFFAERDAAPIVKLVQPDGIALDSIDEIDSALELRGYEKQAPSLTMLLDLAGAVEAKGNLENSLVEKVDAEPWLQAWYALTSRNMEKIDVHKTLFEKSDLSHLFLLKQGFDGAPMSSGMAVYANQAMGLFGISTAMAQRGRGHALEIINSLLCWGFAKGARFAYLQVEEANCAAVNLYQKLGFKKSYSYWYRVGEHKASNSGD